MGRRIIREGGDRSSAGPWRRDLRLEKYLLLSDLWFCARCAPERSEAQRAAPFGKLGTIGFVLNDLMLRAASAPIPSHAWRLQQTARRRARTVALIVNFGLRYGIATPPHSREVLRV
jgi:hypothetical protein